MDPSWALISFSQWHQRVAEANLTLSLCYRERVARHWSYSITVKNPWSLISWKPTHTWFHRSTQLASISKHLLMEIALVLFFLKSSDINQVKRSSTRGVEVDLLCLTKKREIKWGIMMLLLSAVSVKLLIGPGHGGDHWPQSAVCLLVVTCHHISKSGVSKLLPADWF